MENSKNTVEKPASDVSEKEIASVLLKLGFQPNLTRGMNGYLK